SAQKYLVEMNYEPAIAEFNKIIELEPNNVDAYLGLAQAYRDSGDADKAVEVLEKGYDITGDERLRDMLEELTGEAAAEETETAVTAVPETETTTEITTTEEILLMPDLVGMTTAEAVSACTSMGIKYTIQTVENSYVEPGIVLGQSVMANSKLDDNTSVLITVSQKARQETTVTTTTAPVTTTAADVSTTSPVTTTVAETTNNKTEKTQWRMNYFYYPLLEGMGSDNEYTFLYDDLGRIDKCEIKGIYKEGTEEYIHYTINVNLDYSDDMKTIYCDVCKQYTEEKYEKKHTFVFDGKILKRVLEDEIINADEYVMENGNLVGESYIIENAYSDSVFNPYKQGYMTWYAYDKYFDAKQSDITYDTNGNIIFETWTYIGKDWRSNTNGILNNSMTYDKYNNLLTYKQEGIEYYCNEEGENFEWEQSVCLEYGYEMVDSSKVSKETQLLNGLIIEWIVQTFDY
ncbi:MAG: PASTA domain-containing protein, partial [Oscillospiraceae bacterium]